jgi:hypothetical protein
MGLQIQTETRCLTWKTCGQMILEIPELAVRLIRVQGTEMEMARPMMSTPARMTLDCPRMATVRGRTRKNLPRMDSSGMENQAECRRSPCWK